VRPRVEIVKLRPDAIVPKYMTDDAAGMDLCAAIDGPVELAPGQRRMIGTGLAMAIPRGFEGQVRPRSGLARMHGVTCANAPGSALRLHVRFPNCWDGRRLDSPDHHSHMAHSRGYVCPASHPVKVPLIRLLIRYPITDGHGLMLASGGQLTGHADFFNAWDQSKLERLVDECFHDRPCDPNHSD